MKRHIKYLTLFLSWNITLAAHADPYIGGRVGLGFANQTVSTDEPVVADRTYKTGGLAAIFSRSRRWAPLIPQAELAFISRGTNAKIEGQAGGLFNMSYLNFGLLVHIENPVHEINPYLTFGVGLDYLIHATVTEQDGSKSDITDGFRSLDIVGILGIGVAAPPFYWGTLAVELRYDHGFRSVDNLDFADIHNRTISLMLGYEYRRKPRGPKDRDHDGIFDNLDQCPDQPEDINDFEDDDGCPDAAKDADHDGVFDGQDQCRGQAEDRDGIRDDDGCPDPDLDPHPDTGTDTDSPPEDDSDDAPAEKTPGAGSKPRAMLYRGPVCPRLAVPPLTPLLTSLT